MPNRKDVPLRVSRCEVLGSRESGCRLFVVVSLSPCSCQRDQANEKEKLEGTFTGAQGASDDVQTKAKLSTWFRRIVILTSSWTHRASHLSHRKKKRASGSLQRDKYHLILPECTHHDSVLQKQRLSKPSTIDSQYYVFQHSAFLLYSFSIVGLSRL